MKLKYKLIFLFCIFFLFSCVKRDYLTIFYIDQNNGVFIPISYISRGSVENSCIFIVETLTKVKVSKVSKLDQNLDIHLSSIPKVKYEFDSYLLYYSLYLSLFSSFFIEKINFYYNDNLLSLGGIDYSMDYSSFYKYPINDFYNISDARKGKYFLYNYNGYLVPFLVPKDYNWDFYFKNSIAYFNQKGIKLSTMQSLMDKDLVLENYHQNYLVFRARNLFYFLSLYLDKGKVYYVFYNSELVFIVIKYNFGVFEFSLKINRPEKLFLNKYPLNLK